MALTSYWSANHRYKITILSSGTADVTTSNPIASGELILTHTPSTPLILNMHGGAFTHSLTVTTINYGGTETINIGDTTHSAFTNAGVIHDVLGALNLDINGAPVVNVTTFTNTGTIEADRGATITIDTSHGWKWLWNAGVLNNQGLIEANGGTINIASGFTQPQQGHMKIDNGGTIALIRSSPMSGTIDITRGMLDFSGVPPFSVSSWMYTGTARNFGGTLILGQAATLKFTLTIPIDEVFKSLGHDAAELLVYRHTSLPGSLDQQPIADLHLRGHYTASEFRAVGTSVLFDSNSFRTPTTPLHS